MCQMAVLLVTKVHMERLEEEYRIFPSLVHYQLGDGKWSHIIGEPSIIVVVK